MTVPIHSQASAIPRSVEIREDENITNFWLSIRSGEQVLVMYTDGSGAPAYPFRGIIFPADTQGVQMRLRVIAPEAAEDGQWRIRWGVQDKERYIGAGGPIRPRPENAWRIPVRHLQVPVDVDGMEIHLFPFLVDGNHTGALMIAISKDREVLREHLRLMKTDDFDWEKSFETAESFLPLRNRAQKGGNSQENQE